MPRDKKKNRSQSTTSAEPKPSTINSSPLPNVPILYFNKLKGTSNFSTWREKFAIYVGGKYGRCQDLILTGKKYDPPAIRAPAADAFEAENDPFGTEKKCYQKLVSSRLEHVLEMEQNYSKIFNDALSTFSRESEEMVRQCPDFAAADADKCPGKLVAVCAKTHQQPQSGAKVVDADTANARYYGLTQGNTLLPQHKKNFDDAIDMLVAAGESRPSDEKLAARFIASLDPNRYAQWKVDLENNVKAGLAVMPKTLPDAYSRAFMLKKVGHAAQPIADASVFVAHADQRGGGGRGGSDRGAGTGGRGKGKDKSAKPKNYGDRKPAAEDTSRRGKCRLCKQEGHFVANCPMLEDDGVTEYIQEKMGSGAARGGVDAVHIGAQGHAAMNDIATYSGQGTAGHVVLPTIGVRMTEAIRQGASARASEVLVDRDEDDMPALIDYDSDSDSDYDDADHQETVEAIQRAVALPATNEGPNEWLLLLDTEATIPVVKNGELLENIRPADIPVRVDGIGGSMVIDQAGDLRDFGTVYYDPSALANVLCFADVEDRGKITYCQRQSLFRVVINRNTYIFKRIRTGDDRKLYACDMRQHARGRLGIVCVTTVSENEALFTRREVGDARRARELSRRLGYPSLNHLIKIVKHMENSPVRVSDVYRAAKIWGPEIAYLKGTTRNVKTEHIPVEHIPRPEGRVVQTLHIDLMYVEGEAFLMSKTTPLGLRMASHLGHGKGARSAPNIKPRVEQQLSNYSAAGFEIGTLLTDNEGGVMASLTMIQNKGIAVNPSSAGKHVPVIENDIKTVKSRVRTHIHALPFLLCRLLLVWLVLYCVSNLNLEPSSVNVDDFCPREIFLQRGVNYKRDLRIGFGDYAQVQVPLDESELNKMDARTEGAIALWPTGNLQGSVKFLLLGSLRVVTRDQWVPLPMPPPVIDYLNKLAEKHPVSKDPKFSVGGREVEEADDAPMGAAAMEALRDGPVRVVPSQSDLANPVSEPAVEELAGTRVVDAAMDISDSILPTVEATTVDAVPMDPVEAHDTDVGAPDHGVPAVDDGVPSDDIESVLEPEPVRAEVEHAHNTRRGPRKDYAALSGRRVRRDPERHYGLHISVNKALNKLGRTALYSMLDEMIQFHMKEVATPIRKRDLTFKQLKSVIRSSMFLKEKYLSTGEFEKLKSRLVAGGDMQDRSLYDDVTSPTVATPAVFMAVAIAARERRKVATIDIGGAFLNAEMGHHNVYMMLDPLLAAILQRVDAKYQEYVNDDGSIIVKLNKALYGCVQSSKLWYEHLSGTLEAMGFERNPLDKCVFNKVIDGKQCTMCLHVDDLLVTCELEEVIDAVYGQLQDRYKEVKMQRGPKVSYLGMTLDFSVPGKAKCTMEGYVSDLLRLCEVTGRANTPAAESLFEIGESPPLTTEVREEFHSRVAKLLYLAKRVRPDLLVSVSFLATRVRGATEQDHSKLDRVLRYLNATADLGLTLEVSDPITVLGYIDASYGVHVDGKSHTGTVITLGKGIVYAKSSKQKVVSKSSTEAELIGLSDSASQVIWTRDFLIGQGYQLDAATIYQDNMSTMALVKKGQSNSERSRHINIRYFFVKDRVEQGDVKIEYKPTGEMIADVLTKPLQGSLFARLRDKLLNCCVV